MIATERLVLRQPVLDDFDAMLELVGDDEVMRWLGGETGGRDLARATVERWIAGWERDGVGHFAVLHDGEIVGRVGLLVWDARAWEPASYEDAGAHAETELGWALMRRFWGHGYATEAARGVRSWAYDERGLERVVSLISPENARSRRVAERLGARVDRRLDLPTGPADVWVHPR